MYSTGNCIQYLVIMYNRKESEEEYLSIYLNHFAVRLIIVNQLYFNKKKNQSLKKKEWLKDLTQNHRRCFLPMSILDLPTPMGLEPLDFSLSIFHFFTLKMHLLGHFMCIQFWTYIFLRPNPRYKHSLPQSTSFHMPAFLMYSKNTCVFLLFSEIKLFLVGV